MEKITCGFEGCPPNLGGTMILRGPVPRPELLRVKEVLKFMAYVAYSLRLEVCLALV